MYDMNPLKLPEIYFTAQNMVYVLHVSENNVIAFGGGLWDLGLP